MTCQSLCRALSPVLLKTGVTVLSSDDPVRVFERFASVDALSSGRAEVKAGYGRRERLPGSLALGAAELLGEDRDGGSADLDACFVGGGGNVPCIMQLAGPVP